MKLNLKPSKETKIATNEQIQKKEVTEKKEFTKLYKYTTNKNIIEFSDKGFFLENRNSNGELNGLNCKVSIQFSEFDKQFHQTKYCAFFKKLEESQKTNKPAFVFQGGGVYEGKIYARTLQISASKMKDSCCLILWYGEGTKSKTGGYVFKENASRSNMTIPISLLEFGGILEDISNRIPLDVKAN